MDAFDPAVFDAAVFDTVEETVIVTATPRRRVDDTRRIWGLLMSPNLERISKEYRVWWRGR